MDSKAASERRPCARNTLLYTVLIPAYNEEENIAPTVRAITAVLRPEGIPHEILIVNDNSKDRTPEVVEELSREIPEVRMVCNTPPGGLGRAIRCGLKHFNGDVVAIVMADSSDSPEDIVRCYRKIEEGYDCAFGSRFMRGSKLSQYPTVKYIVNRIGNRMLQAMFFTRCNDLTNAFKVYRRHVIESISPLQAAHFNITIEMSLSALIRQFDIAVFPISWSGRTWGQSSLSLRKMLRRYLCTMLMIWFEHLLILDDLMLEKAPKKDLPHPTEPGGSV